MNRVLTLIGQLGEPTGAQAAKLLGQYTVCLPEMFTGKHSLTYM